MKRALSLILALMLCLSLCACGKSEAVKNVETIIDALGEITLESIDAIRSAEDAYNALTEDEQKKVDNYETLTEARDAYYALALVGKWTDYSFNMWDIEGMYNQVRMVLNADMTYTHYGELEETGIWTVSNKTLILDPILQIDIIDDNGKLTLGYDNKTALMSQTDFHTLLDDMFLIVDLAEVDINDYCELYIYHHEGVDAWGSPTGTSSDSIRIGSKAYRDGWCYFDAKEVAIEVFHPAYEEIHEYSDGTTSTYSYEASTLTADYKSLFIDTLMKIKTDGSKDNWHKTITVDQLSFGRAKGLLYFVNLDYIVDFPYVDDLNRGITLFNGQGIPYANWDENLWDEDHPY